MGVGCFVLESMPGGFLHRQGGVTLCYKIYGGGGCFLKMNIVCVEPSVYEAGAPMLWFGWVGGWWVSGFLTFVRYRRVLNIFIVVHLNNCILWYIMV